jgi:membrane associated rhomboid family serine protease
MWFLWIFGDNVELSIGHLKYILFYLAAGIVAALTQYMFNPASDIPMIGASGAVAGVLGMYLAKFKHHRVDALLPTPIGFFYRTLPASFVLLFWFIGQVFSGTASLAAPADAGGVAFWAHIGGFVFGWVLGKILPSKVFPVSALNYV